MDRTRSPRADAPRWRALPPGPPERTRVGHKGPEMGVGVETFVNCYWGPGQDVDPFDAFIF